MKLLIYVEPHPIRGGAYEFLNVARRFAALARRGPEWGAQIRLAASRPVAAALEPFDGLVAASPEEQAAFDAFAGPWDDARIADWLGLVDGDGPAAAAQAGFLDRVLDEFPADCLIVWSENAAARRAARTRGLPILHCELGPTRFPFLETVYCDPDGVNGNAAMRAAAGRALRRAEAAGAAPPAPWRAFVGTAPKRRADGPPVVFVPLQFADDLNTLRHSDFASPRDFLARTLPALADQGARIVIKGHPGAGLRAYNAAKQNEALAWARAWRARAGADVAFLHPKAGFRRTAEAIRAAACTMTINSSVGFESLLLGAPTLLKGRAAYDAGGLLQEKIPDLAAAQRPDALDFCERLAADHLGGRLLPAPLFWRGDLFARICRAAVEEGAPPRAPLDAAAAIAAHPLWPAGEGESGASPPDAASPFGLTGGARVASREIVLADEAGERILPRGEGFRLCVEDRSDLGLCGRIAGWAFERETGRAPAYVLALADGEAVSVAAPSSSRAAVAAAWPEARQPVGFELAIPKRVPLDRVVLIAVSVDGWAQPAPAGVAGALGGTATRLHAAARAGLGRLRRMAVRSN